MTENKNNKILFETNPYGQIKSDLWITFGMFILFLIVDHLFGRDNHFFMICGIVFVMLFLFFFFDLYHITIRENNLEIKYPCNPFKKVKLIEFSAIKKIEITSHSQFNFLAGSGLFILYLSNGKKIKMPLTSFSYEEQVSILKFLKSKNVRIREVEEF